VALLASISAVKKLTWVSSFYEATGF